jgi:signal peptidase I, archaeal type
MKNNNSIEAPVKKSVRVWGGITDILFVLLVITIVLGSILFATSRDANKSYFGYRFYYVKTDSMKHMPGNPKGGFSKGDLLVVNMVTDPSVLEVGDIVTFNPSMNNPETYLTHRITAIKRDPSMENEFLVTTQGDNNPSEDPPFSSMQVIGTKAFVIPFVYSAFMVIEANWIVFAIIGVALIGFFVTWKIYLKKSKEEKEEAWG